MPIPAAAIVCAVLAQGPLGNPPAPGANPVTEPKRVLGKILFWDEQLSSSNTVACGTCHTPAAGGGDARRSRHPGSDGLFMSGDDVFGSPGVILSDGQNNFSPEPNFAFASQVTARSANTAYMGAYSNLNFWDGRAGPSLVDPLTGTTLIPGGAALEAQVLGPPVSNVEMGHFGRNWADVVAKLGGAQPLALADQIPEDVVAALADSPSYATLFQRAFGSPQVTPGRVAMAIATYERTLVPNHTPWDRWASGDTSAMTPRQVLGMNLFNSDLAKCADCHGSNRFTDNAFHNIGVRPSVEDPGRESITGIASDVGKFRTPSLRNAGLRTAFFHNGAATTLRQTVDFYTRRPGALPQFTDNLDPGVLDIVLSDDEADAITEFIAVGLTDPRVAGALAPFDHPRLWADRASLQPADLGGGTPRPGATLPPAALTPDPAVIGGDCRIAVTGAPAGWSAVARVSTSAPAAGVVTGGMLLPAAQVGDDGAVTVRLTVDAAHYLAGVPLHVQWELSPTAGGAIAARSTVARIVPFCPRAGCVSPCPADLGGAGGVTGPDGVLNNNDFIAFINLFFQLSPAADIGVAGGLAGSDGQHNNNDFIAFIQRFFEGC